MNEENNFELQPCILSYFDFIGVRKLAKEGKTAALMSKVSRFVDAYVNMELVYQDHGYIWNDSIMLLSYQTSPKSRRPLLRELNTFREKLHKHVCMDLFGIVVSGMTFSINDSLKIHPKFTILKTSSWAMANCFEIEEIMKTKRKKATWYIEGRLDRKGNLGDLIGSEMIKMLPSRKPRKVNMYRSLKL